MALGNKENAVYLSIRNGKVSRYSKTKEEGTTTVKTQAGEERYYYLYDYVDGLITGLKTKQTEFAGQNKTYLVVSLNDEGETYQMEIDLVSNYFQSFANAVLNADVNAPIKIIPTMKEVDGKKNTGMIIMQNGQAMKWKFTKENPGGMPDIVVTRNKKNEVVDVDRDDRNNFLFAELDKWVGGAVSASKTPLPASPVLEEANDLDINDLPF
jgi:hypothetical protein